MINSIINQSSFYTITKKIKKSSPRRVKEAGSSNTSSPPSRACEPSATEGDKDALIDERCWYDDVKLPVKQLYLTVVARSSSYRTVRSRLRSQDKPYRQDIGGYTIIKLIK